MTTSEDNNPNLIRPRYPFRYESFDEPKLRILRETYALDQVVSGGPNEFAEMRLLREWVKRRWTHAEPDVSGHGRLNALELLGLANEGKRFYCHHYALTFVQCAVALGWQARVLGIETCDGPGHNVAEIWSDTFGKWIVMDPDYDCHYERSDVPMNAWEIHNAWQTCGARMPDDIHLRIGKAGEDSDQGKQIKAAPACLMDFYFRFFLFMGNNFFQADPVAPILAVTGRRLHWYDALTPRLVSPASRAHSHFYTDTFSNRIEDFYWDPN